MKLKGIFLLTFTSCALPALPLISSHPSLTALQVSMVVCCLPSFPSRPGSGSRSSHFLPTGDELLLQLLQSAPLQPVPASAGQPPVSGMALPWGSRSLAVPRERCLQLSCLERAPALLHLGWG